jgi:hypothetical protein
VTFERLEPRRLASVSYVQVGVKVKPNIHNELPVYFSANLPAGNYLIAVTGGSMTYNDGLTPVVYQVNDYNAGNYGYKVVEPGVPLFDAPGLSVPKKKSAIASADSIGVYLKFLHSTPGKIGIELNDDPLQDNAIGIDGSPVFILKERLVASPAAVPATEVWASTPFFTSSIAAPLLDWNAALQDKLDSLV